MVQTTSFSLRHIHTQASKQRTHMHTHTNAHTHGSIAQRDWGYGPKGNRCFAEKYFAWRLKWYWINGSNMWLMYGSWDVAIKHSCTITQPRTPNSKNSDKEENLQNKVKWRFHWRVCRCVVLLFVLPEWEPDREDRSGDCCVGPS